MKFDVGTPVKVTYDRWKDKLGGPYHAEVEQSCEGDIIAVGHDNWVGDYATVILKTKTGSEVRWNCHLHWLEHVDSPW